MFALAATKATLLLHSLLLTGVGDPKLPECTSRDQPGAGVSCYIGDDLPFSDNTTVPGVAPFHPPNLGHFQVTITDWIAPLFLLVISCGGLVFLWQREAVFTRFIQWISLCVGVAVLFYHPEVLVNIAEYFGGIVGVG